MQFRRHGFVTALLMIMSLLLAACGGNQSSGPTATAPPVAQRQSATPTATPIQSTTTPTTPPTVSASPTPTQHTSPTVVPSPTTSPTAVPSATPTRKAEPTSKPTKASKPATPTNTPEPTNTPTSEPTNTPSPTATPTKPPAPTATPTQQAPAVGMPSRLLINTDDVHVDSHVEYVGQTPDGAMDVPKKWEDVAWYQPGYAPGSKGNSVIAGHLDSTTGPAVFIDLDKIQVGDVITVVDKNGQKLDFKVTKTAVYYNDKAPLYDIFGPSDTADLNLITCDGAWNEGKKEYNQKLVVFSTLVSDSGDNSG